MFILMFVISDLDLLGVRYVRKYGIGVDIQFMTQYSAQAAGRSKGLLT